jgi:hypothetical protein
MSITHIGQQSHNKLGIKPPSTLPNNNSNMPNMPILELHNMTPANAGAAYERKKQRAKDARIKLNDAIEHLAIGISLAGSQSKQRNALLTSRIPVTESRDKTIQISEECSKLAEQVKKWDRPSFVGTAASLVHGLNSQCESLMRELVGLQEQLDAASGGVPPKDFLEYGLALSAAWPVRFVGQVEDPWVCESIARWYQQEKKRYHPQRKWQESISPSS